MIPSNLVPLSVLMLDSFVENTWSSGEAELSSTSCSIFQGPKLGNLASLNVLDSWLVTGLVLLLRPRVFSRVSSSRVASCKFCETFAFHLQPEVYLRLFRGRWDGLYATGLGSYADAGQMGKWATQDWLQVQGARRKSCCSIGSSTEYTASETLDQWNWVWWVQ